MKRMNIEQFEELLNEKLSDLIDEFLER